MMDSRKIDQLAKTLWDFLTLNQQPEKSNAIVALGSFDLNVPKWASKLAKEGYAPIIVMSGGRGRLTPVDWEASEAEKFADVAIESGINENRIYIDAESTNTRENIINTLTLLKINGFQTNKLIIVTFPFHEKRAKAFFEKYSPTTETFFNAPPTTYEDYPNQYISKEELINILVGEVLRLVEYPKRGYINEQEVPENIIETAETLKNEGYQKYTTF